MTTTFIWKDGREETYDWDVTWGSSGYGFFKCTRFERSHFLDTPFIPDAAVRTLGESENLLRMSGVYVESDWQAADALRHHQVTQSTEHPMPQFELCEACMGRFETLRRWEDEERARIPTAWARLLNNLFERLRG
jgi:hypothetical protein